MSAALVQEEFPMRVLANEHVVVATLLLLGWGLAAGAMLLVFARALNRLKAFAVKGTFGRIQWVVSDIVLTISMFASIIPWGVSIDVIDDARHSGLVLALFLAAGLGGIVSAILLTPASIYENR